MDAWKATPLWKRIVVILPLMVWAALVWLASEQGMQVSWMVEVAGLVVAAVAVFWLEKVIVT